MIEITNDFTEEKMNGNLSQDTIVLILRHKEQYVYIEAWGQKTGDHSYPRSVEGALWQSTYHQFYLREKPGLRSIWDMPDDTALPDEKFGFDDDMNLRQRILRWNTLFRDSHHWELLDDSDFISEENRSKEDLAKYILNQMDDECTLKIVITKGNSSLDISNSAEKVISDWLSEHADFYAETFGLGADN